MMPGSDISSVAAGLVPYLNLVDVASLRLTCRGCKAYVDGALTQLRPFNLPNGGFHRLSVPPHLVYKEPIKAPGSSKLHAPFDRGGFQQVALCAPGLRSLEVQCAAKGCLDFGCLQGLSQLAGLTLLEFPFSDPAAFVGVGRCTRLRSLRLQSCEESLLVSHLSSLRPLLELSSLLLEPRSFQKGTYGKWRGLAALSAMTSLTELRLVYSDEIPGGGSDPAAMVDAWQPVFRAFDASATQVLSECLSSLTGLRVMEIRGLQSIPRGIAVLRGLRRLSLEEMAHLNRSEVAVLASLTQLTALTLLWDAAATAHDQQAAQEAQGDVADAADAEPAAAHAAAAGGDALQRRGRGGRSSNSSSSGLLVALTALVGLRELVFGVEDAGTGRPHGHSLHPRGHHTIAYLCGEQLECLSCLQGLTHLSLEPRGWQSCCTTAHFATADAAVAALRTPLARLAPWLAGQDAPTAVAQGAGLAADEQLPAGAVAGPGVMIGAGVMAGNDVMIAAGGGNGFPLPLAATHATWASSLGNLGKHSLGAAALAQGAAGGSSMGGASLFTNHPDLGSFLVAWPLCTVLHMEPCLGKLPPAERALVNVFIRKAEVGKGLLEGGGMGGMFAHLQLAQQRSSLHPSLVMPRLAAAGGCLRRIDLTLDKRWSQAAMGQLGSLEALPSLQALRLDCSRLDAPEALWAGLARLCRLRWLSLRWFNTVPVVKALGPLVQLEALQLRDLGHLPELGDFVTALSGMRRLRYVGLEGCPLDAPDDLLGGLWGLLSGDRYSLAWIELTLTRQPMLQLLASLMGSFFLGSLLHAPRWPEMVLTFLLALTLGGLLAAATALVLVPMLLGWGPGAQLHQQLAPIRQLRYLSLRRSSFCSSQGSSFSLSTPRRRANSLMGLARCLPELRFLDASWLNAEPGELLGLARLPGLHYLALQRSQLGPRWEWQMGASGAVVLDAPGGLEKVIEREVMGVE